MKGLLLLSAGIDSPVAGHIMIKKAVDVIAVHFDNRPLTDSKPLEIVKQLCKKIGIKRLYVIPHGTSQVELIKNTNPKLRCVLCRRLMFRVAEKISEKESCDFLITGENLAQVASQSLENMITAKKAVSVEIIRPLLCLDKQETIDIAKQIGTYKISTQPSMCCVAVPKFPATRSKDHIAKKEEEKAASDKIVETAFSSARVIGIK